MSNSLPDEILPIYSLCLIRALGIQWLAPFHELSVSVRLWLQSLKRCGFKAHYCHLCSFLAKITILACEGFPRYCEMSTVLDAKSVFSLFSIKILDRILHGLKVPSGQKAEIEEVIM